MAWPGLCPHCLGLTPSKGDLPGRLLQEHLDKAKSEGREGAEPSGLLQSVLLN